MALNRRGFLGALAAGVAAAAMPRPVAARLLAKREERRRGNATTLESFNEILKRHYPETKIAALAAMPMTPLLLVARADDGSVWITFEEHPWPEVEA